MSRRNILIAAAIVAVLALGGLGYYLFQRSQGSNSAAPRQQAAAAAPAVQGARGALPAPIFLVIDKAAVFRFSKAGQDIARQMQPMVQQAQTSLGAQRAALDRDVQQLQQDTSVTGTERDKRIAALDARQQALQADAERRQLQLQEAMARANDELAKALEQIVPPIVKERGANIVLDRAALPQADAAFDITPEVIKQLDARITTVKITLDAPR